MAAPKWTDGMSARLIELHAAGETQASVAKVLQVSTKTLQVHSKDLGLTWAGARVKAGARTKSAQNHERRATLADELLTLADERLKFVKGETYKDLVKGEYGAEVTAELDYVPSRSIQAEMAALKSLTAAVKELKALEDLNNGGSSVDGWLGFMAQGEVRMKIIAQKQWEAATTGDEDASLRNGELQA